MKNETNTNFDRSGANIKPTKYRVFGGTFGLFIIILFINIFAGLFDLYTLFPGIFKSSGLNLSLHLFIIVLNLFILSYIGFCVYILTIILKKRNNSIFLCKFWSILSLIILMLIFLDLLTNISQLILIGITLVLIHLAWFLYFDKSKRLIELFPIETRTHSKLDLIILSAFSLLIAATVILTEIVRFTHN